MNYKLHLSSKFMSGWGAMAQSSSLQQELFIKVQKFCELLAIRVLLYKVIIERLKSKSTQVWKKKQKLFSEVCQSCPTA